MKALLSALGTIEPSNLCLMDFDLDKATPRLPLLVTFQTPVLVQNITIHHCIIDEGASTCIMSKNVWYKLQSPKLNPSDIILIAYDGRPSAPVGLYQNVLVFLASKMVLINLEVLDAQLDYNILLGRSYMYSMSAIASSVFRTMMFPMRIASLLLNN